jgi:7-cyano-7-deazaguanine reductase
MATKTSQAPRKSARAAAASPAPAVAAAPASPVRKPRQPRQAAAPKAVERPMPPNPPSAPSKQLHTFDNPAPERDYLIQFQVPEFTCHCPLTGQPDFAHFTIDMICDRLCVELKSLKMYFWSYRDEGAFHEKVTNTILSDIVKVTQPRYIRITAKWYVRGGIYTNVVVEHRKKGWKPAPVVDLPSLPVERGLLG